MIIAIANQKGGVGKTTLTIHLAVYLARRGKRVCVIDAAMFELLVVGTPAHKLVRRVDAFGIDLLCGNHRTGEAFIFLAATNKPFCAVSDALCPLIHNRDVVLIDMPPSMAAGFAETLYAADWVLVPCQLERLALEGVGYMAATCTEMRRTRHGGPQLLGVVPNMARARTNEHQAQMDDLVTAFGAAVWPPIPLSVRVAEAASLGTTVWDLPNHLPDAAGIAGAMNIIGERLLTNAKI